MRGNFTAGILWVALIVSAHGSVVDVPVTPDSLEHDGFRFTVSATPIEYAGTETGIETESQDE